MFLSKFLVLFFLGFFYISQSAQSAQNSALLSALPVQSQGRIKPFNTFARETLQFVHGQNHFQNTPAEEVLLSWVLFPDVWNQTKFVPILDFKLKKAFGMDVKTKLFSPAEILQNPYFINEIEELKSRQRDKVALDSYFKSLQKLENQLILYQVFQKGKEPGWIPSDIEGKKSWRSWEHFTKEEKQLFHNIFLGFWHTFLLPKQAYVIEDSSIVTNSTKQALLKRDIIKGEMEGGGGHFITKKVSYKQAILDFQQAVKRQYPLYKEHLSKMSVELHYNWFNPLRWAWVFYLLGLLCLGLLFLGGLKNLNQNKWGLTFLNKGDIGLKIWPGCFTQKVVFYSVLSFFILGFCMQGYGMALRSWIMARPPVTNMYETVIWVPWITVILGAILWIRQKMFSVFVCAVVVAFFCLLLADKAPEFLDGSLHPLEAVLRSSFWLIVHVLTITMSYGAFFLAFALGHVALFLFLRQKNRTVDSRIKKYIHCVDRSLQVGVILIAAGTILGGVWADYSWGRFWGWDPKETWALISLLAYLALLHSRLMGYVREFGMAVGAVLLFFFIVMAWYGVNYVLGQGLHSYGFGAGGVEYVASFALLNLIYILLIWAFCPKSLKSPK